MKRWSEEDIEWLKNNYSVNGKEYCMKHLNRSEAQIRQKAHRLNLKLNKNSDFYIEFQKRAADSKIGKKRPDQSIRMKEWRNNGTVNIPEAKIKNKRLNYIFNGMKRRCYFKKSKQFKYYGYRGIEICKEWLENPSNFEKWALKNGYKDSLTIDRIDVNIGYCPENCRWATLKEQANNRTNNIKITYKNETKNLIQFAEEYGIKFQTLYKRIFKYRWSIAKALGEENEN